jgi:predicted nucleotidyltransferase
MRDISREQLLEELRALRPEFERRGVTGMSLFGSRARGDNRPDSDLDLVVDIEKGRRFSGLNLAGLYGLIEDTIGLESSLIVLDRYTSPEFVTRISRDLTPIF